MCDRIENSDRTGTGPDWDHFDRNRTGTGPDFKPKKVNRIRPDWPDFYRIFKTLPLNLQVININITASIFRYELKGKARTRPDKVDLFWVRVHNVAHLRPRSKHGVKNQNLHLRR